MPYHEAVAERKNTERKSTQSVSNRKKTPAKTEKNRTLPLMAIFWLIFIIVITGIFLANRETIGENFDLLVQRLGISPGRSSAVEPDSVFSPDTAVEEPEQDQIAENTAERITSAPPAAAQTQAENPPARPQPAEPETPRQTSSGVPRPENPQSADQPPARPTPSAAPPAKPAEIRERGVYFTQVEKDGTILRLKVNRAIAVSNSPLQDSLTVLLAGPTVEEQRRGIISLIPPNTRVLSSTIRGSTAYISFSEEFQYNTYGVEGYAAQLKQIVWTATEFPTVKDVQILIEGRRVDYLGEGIWIGSPVGRESF